MASIVRDELGLLIETYSTDRSSSLWISFCAALSCSFSCITYTYRHSRTQAFGTSSSYRFTNRLRENVPRLQGRISQPQRHHVELLALRIPPPVSYSSNEPSYFGTRRLLALDPTRVQTPGVLQGRDKGSWDRKRNAIHMSCTPEREIDMRVFDKGKTMRDI
ncbi:hypothetical protein AKJ16_DCAP01311 [Drosera capensis]